MTCTVQLRSVNFSHDGTYTITAKNLAAGNVEKNATDDFNVTVFKNVTAFITPGEVIAMQNSIPNSSVGKLNEIMFLIFLIFSKLFSIKLISYIFFDIISSYISK